MQTWQGQPKHKRQRETIYLRGKLRSQDLGGRRHGYQFSTVRRIFTDYFMEMRGPDFRMGSSQMGDDVGVR